MDRSSESKQVKVQLALQQRLESLARAGVKQLPKWRGPVPELKPIQPSSSSEQADAAVRPAVTSHAADPPQIERSAASTPRPASEPSLPTGSAPPTDKTPTDETPTPTSPAPPAHPVTHTAPTPAESPTAAPHTDRQQALVTLSQQVCQCELCPQLVRNRTQTVFGVGNPHARLCFFGEGPGADEDRQGEPFVGAAGQLLNKIINACTLKREEVYILNAVKCRPPGNRNPTPEEVANCRAYFEQQLEIIRPEFICCLGAVPTQALLETTKSVGRMRGTLHSWRFAQVLVTYHPAYLLRNPSAKKMVWDDMKYLMAQMGVDLNRGR